MLHAIFDIYRCSCEHGCIQKYRSDRAAQHVYHDALWQIAARRLVLCINLGRAGGMTGDVYRGGALPSVDVLKGLGLDKGNILERLKRRRNVDDYERWKKRDVCKK